MFPCTVQARFISDGQRHSTIWQDIVPLSMVQEHLCSCDDNPACLAKFETGSWNSEISMEEIKDRVLALYEIVDACEWEGLRTVFCPEVIYERPGYPKIQGIEDLISFYARTRVIASGRHAVSDMAVEGSKAAVWGEFSGLGRDGKSKEARFVDVLYFEQDVIAHRITHFYQPCL